MPFFPEDPCKLPAHYIQFHKRRSPRPFTSMAVHFCSTQNPPESGTEAFAALRPVSGPPGRFPVPCGCPCRFPPLSLPGKSPVFTAGRIQGDIAIPIDRRFTITFSATFDLVQILSLTLRLLRQFCEPAQSRLFPVARQNRCCPEPQRRPFTTTHFCPMPPSAASSCRHLEVHYITRIIFYNQKDTGSAVRRMNSFQNPVGAL